MDLGALQRPLKERYRAEPDAAKVTLRARGTEADLPIACSVDLGRAVQQAQAHSGVGGAGTAACSGDLLLGALAACAQLTCQMVASALGVPAERPSRGGSRASRTAAAVTVRGVSPPGGGSEGRR